MVLKYEDIQPTCPAPGITRRILAHGGGMMGWKRAFRKVLWAKHIVIPMSR